jgi:hypothetical protein
LWLQQLRLLDCSDLELVEPCGNGNHQDFATSFINYSFVAHCSVFGVVQQAKSLLLVCEEQRTKLLLQQAE